MYMKVSALLTVGLALPLLGLASPAGVQAGPLDYCDPAATRLDPVDVPAGGSDPVDLPSVRSTRLTAAGVNTRVLESDDLRKRTAVVFLHGSPDSAEDFAEYLPLLGNRRAHAVAIDMPGFGQAADAWNYPATPDAAVAFLEDAFEQLGIERAHLIGHDVGGFAAVEWGARHPKALRSITLLGSGVQPDYEQSDLAEITRSPAGVAFWQQMSRGSFNAAIQNGQSPGHLLPPEFTNRLYDDLDRETRCAIIKLYRSNDTPDIRAAANRQIAALDDWADRPALVIWGRNDPYLPVEQASTQRQAFPAARIEIFEESGHWPFIDFPDRARALIVPHIVGAIDDDLESPERSKFPGSRCSGLKLERKASRLGNGSGETIIGTQGEDLIRGAGGRDTIVGLGEQDCLTGGPGRDTIRGKSGDDAARGGPGGDFIKGNRGSDHADGDGGSDRIRLGAGGDVGRGQGGADNISTGRGPDRIAGGAGQDRIFGGPGADVLRGGRGRDLLVGGGGRGQLDGGPGKDRCVTPHPRRVTIKNCEIVIRGGGARL